MCVCANRFRYKHEMQLFELRCALMVLFIFHGFDAKLKKKEYTKAELNDTRGYCEKVSLCFWTVFVWRRKEFLFLFASVIFHQNFHLLVNSLWDIEHTHLSRYTVHSHFNKAIFIHLHLFRCFVQCTFFCSKFTIFILS